jgi:hypothetical protein
MAAPVAATNVQHQRPRYLDQTALENHRCAIDETGIGQHERALAPRHERGLVLHVCCTPTDLAVFVERFWAAWNVRRPKITGLSAYAQVRDRPMSTTP